MLIKKPANQLWIRRPLLETTKQSWQPPTDFREFCLLLRVKSGGKIKPLDLHLFQEKFAQLIDRSQLLICCKSRQQGISTIMAAKALHLAMLDEGATVVILSKTQAHTSQLAEVARRMVSGILNDGRTKLLSDNKQQLDFAGGGSIYFKNGSPSSVRGVSNCCLLIIDEAAFIPDLAGLLTAAAPITSTVENATIILASTPGARGDYFHNELIRGNGDRSIETLSEQIRAGAIDGYQEWETEPGVNKCLISWRTNPQFNHDPQAYLDSLAKSGLTDQQIRVEFELDFSTHAQTIFNSELVMASVVADYEPPDPEMLTKYYLACDPAGGGGDYCAAVVLGTKDDEHFKVVAIYHRSRSTTENYLAGIKDLIDRYPVIEIAVEQNGLGSIFIEWLNSKYPYSKITKFLTTQVSKPAIIQRLVLLLERGGLAIPAVCPLIQELLIYQRAENGQLGAPIGGKNHDDLVQATAIALSLSEFNRQENYNYSRGIEDIFG